MTKLPFSQLLLGAHFKYQLTDEEVYAKIDHNTVAEMRRGGLLNSQSLCCFANETTPEPGLDTEVYLMDYDHSKFTPNTVVCRRYTLNGREFYHYDHRSVYNSVPVTLGELIKLASLNKAS